MTILDANPELATQQFGRALELLRRQAVPSQHAETERGTVVAFVATEYETGAAHLVNTHRTPASWEAVPWLFKN